MEILFLVYKTLDTERMITMCYYVLILLWFVFHVVFSMNDCVSRQMGQRQNILLEPSWGNHNTSLVHQAPSIIKYLLESFQGYSSLTITYCTKVFCIKLHKNMWHFHASSLQYVKDSFKLTQKHWDFVSFLEILFQF